MDDFKGAESALERIEPGYLQRVRIAAGQLGLRGQGPDLVTVALSDLRDAVHIDVEAPTYASQRGGRALKALVKRSVQWYIRYLAVQISALGQATIGLGTAMADRLDELEASNRVLQQKVDDLTRRLESPGTSEEHTRS